MIVDAHVHFWDPDLLHYAWLDGLLALRRRFIPGALDYGRHDVTALVFVEANRRSGEALAEVEWVAGLAAAHPEIAAIVAHAPLELGDGARGALEALAAWPLVTGVRRLLQGEPEALVRSGALAAGVGLLGELSLSFDACVTHDQLPALTALADRCPDVTIILDHLGKPAIAAGRQDPWRSDLAALALRPNVHCKLSGLTTEAGGEDVRPYLDHALDVFGVGRCLVGSDWPVATLTTTCEQWFDVLLETLAGASPADRHAVLAGNATTLYLPT
jgi:L-fuconolactonase